MRLAPSAVQHESVRQAGRPVIGTPGVHTHAERQHDCSSEHTAHLGLAQSSRLRRARRRIRYSVNITTARTTRTNVVVLMTDSFAWTSYLICSLKNCMILMKA